MHFLAAALLLAAAGWIYGPALLHPFTDLPFFIGDGATSVWNYWWAKRSLIDLGVSPFATDLLTYPHQVSLVFHSLDLLHGLLTIPFQLVFEHPRGLVSGTNAVLLFCLWFSAFSAYLCAWSLTRDRFASLAAGVGYGFCAFHVNNFAMPVWGALYWLPLFALSLRSALGHGGLARTAAVGAIVLLVSFQSLYYVVFLGLVAAILAGVELARAGFPRTLVSRTSWVAGACVLALVPMATLATVDLLKQTYESAIPLPTLLPARTAVAFLSIDLAGLVIPTPKQGWWQLVPAVGSWNDYLDKPSNPMPYFKEIQGGATAYVGVLTLVLAAWGARREIRGAAPPWLALASVSLLIALGPHLFVWGWEGRWWWLPMPVRLILALPGPLGQMFRMPATFAVPAILGIWMLAACGIAQLRARLPDAAARSLATAGLAIWLIGEHAYAPQPPTPFALSPGLQRVAQDPRAVSLLQFPANDPFLAMWYAMKQTLHGKPIARGYLARLSVPVVARDRRIAAISRRPAALDALLAEMRPVYVIVSAAERNPRIRRLVAERLAGHEIYDDGKEIVYAPDPSPEPPP
jgi:hypothetical protein